MSHDEVNHVVPAYDLYQGTGYAHDPVTHGPFQFHLLAASYFIMGDSDFSARVPAALFSIAAVAFVMLAFPKYLGRKGALLAGLFFLISPFLLYYGRYTRNEAFIELFAVMMLYAVLRYLDKRDNFSLILLTVTSALHFTTKETAYMYVAELMVFLAVYLFIQLAKSPKWKSTNARKLFIFFSLLAITLFALTGYEALQSASEAEVVEDGTAYAEGVSASTWMVYFGVAFAAVAVGDLIYLISNVGWKTIREEASFDLLMILGITVLPLLTAFPVKMLGWNALDYSNAGMIRTGGIFLIMVAIAFGLGWWWNRSKFVLHMGIFYSIFTIFYTTFFTNPKGFATGMVGSLGYWLVQQSVERGTQPLYYYALIQMPIYEYLSIIGLLLASVFGIKTFITNLGDKTEETAKPETQHETSPIPVLPLLLYWSIASLIVFSVAGERMPWLTVHIAIPFALTAAWAVGKFLDQLDWKNLFSGKAILSLLVIPVLLFSLFGIVGSLSGARPPFQGKELLQLEDTFGFLLMVITAALSLFALYKLYNGWQWKNIGQLLVLSFLVVLTLLTARTAYMAAFPNADYATEFLVYAHATPAPKEILAQIESLSYRITGGKGLDISYDNDSLYPYWWYFRDYSNVNYFAENPTRDIADSAVILASSPKYGKIEAIVKDNFVTFDYLRLWWPMQDYYGLTPQIIWERLSDPAMRSALFQIWLNRDYTEYADIKQSNSLTLENWSPSDEFRLYIRKDVISQMWEYGASPTFEGAQDEDPYLQNILPITADAIIGSPGTQPGQLNAPHGLAIAPDGSIYVADSNNHRIQQFATDGTLLNAFGTYADAYADSPNAPGGTFNEPWDVAVDAEGFVYVADTWNHRIQKFTADGEFVQMWANFGGTESLYGLWGPRSIVVDSNNQVYVTDTGNKRVIVYDTDGNAIGQFGGVGFDAGQFDEPVGLAIDSTNVLYVADTWNRRVQSLFFDAGIQTASSINMWDVFGWYGESLENKPYIAVGPAGDVFITDPEGYRVIQFDAEGNYIQNWGTYSQGFDGFGLPAGIAVDADGGVWVSDAGNGVLLHFTLPNSTE
jgi:predicted membrane-bound mannosyltransferase/DNA-binding beta-propeller fold protein YncE